MTGDPAGADAVPCGYVSTDAVGLVTTVNAAFERLSGRGRGELTGRTRFTQLLSGGGRIYLETHLWPLLLGDGAVSGVALELVRPDGTRVPVLVNAVADRAADGALAAVHLAVFSASERRSYEKELLRTLRRAEASEAHATALARTLQQVLIPHEPPVVPGLDIAAAYRPAHDGREIGGDFYDFFEVADEGWVFVVGDVCGKGAAAAVVTALVRHSLRSVVRAPDQLDEALLLLNDTLLRHSERFATVALVHVRREGEGWRATVSCGGHPLPLLRRHCSAPELFGAPGSLVGAVTEVAYGEESTVLGPGDALLLYTDGVPEGRSGREFYGEKRLVERFSMPGTSAEVVAAVLQDVLAFQQDDPSDDIALVMVRVPD